MNKKINFLMLMCLAVFMSNAFADDCPPSKAKHGDSGAKAQVNIFQPGVLVSTAGGVASQTAKSVSAFVSGNTTEPKGCLVKPVEKKDVKPPQIKKVKTNEINS